MPAELKSISPAGRVIAVSDIHAHLALFDSLLETVNFGESDTLIVDGDLIERGPDSLGVVRRVLRLAERGNVYVARGNMDVQISRAVLDGERIYGNTLRDYLRWSGNCLVTQMCAELGADVSNGYDPEPLLPALRQRFARELSLLHDSPVMLRAGKYLFVHGGLTDPDPEVCARGEAWPLLKNDGYLNHACPNGLWQVVGHWPVTLYRDGHPDCSPLADRERKIVCIDGGCGIKRAAQLNAMLIPSVWEDAFSFAWTQDFPVYVSPVDQPGSETSVYIKWPDNYVRVLERRDGMAFLEHENTGYRLWAPEGYLWADGGRCRMQDFTDYHLPVFRGEYVYLIHKSPTGALCKKSDGSIGWIFA